MLKRLFSKFEVELFGKRGFCIKEVDAETLIEETLAKDQPVEVAADNQTRGFVAVRGYRDVIRLSRFFNFADERGVLWKDKLRESARKEFEDARFERDPEVVTKLLINGREALRQTVEKFIDKTSEVFEKEKKPRT